LSAKDILTIVRKIGGDTGEVTRAIESTRERVTKGEALTKSTGVALQQITASAEQAVTSSNGITRLVATQEERARSLLADAAESLGSVKMIARATQEQRTAIERIRAGVRQMKDASEKLEVGMSEQVRANHEYNRGLGEREGQIGAINAAISFQNEVSARVFNHFSASQQRLASNLERAGVIAEEIAAMEVMTARLHTIAAAFDDTALKNI